MSDYVSVRGWIIAIQDAWLLLYHKKLITVVLFANHSVLNRRKLKH